MFADELTDITANPQHSDLLQFNLGSGWVHLHPTGGPFSSPQNNNVYSYILTGEGSPLKVRINDGPLSDNNGLMYITVCDFGTATPPLRQRQRAR